MSDKQLTQESNFFSYLETGDVLADHGFKIADVAVHGAELEIPACLHVRKKNNLHSKRLSSINSCPWYAFM